MIMLSPLAPQGEPQPFRLRIEDYELLDRAGAFANARVELIEGVIVAVNAQYQAHSWVKMKLTFRLQAALEALGSPYMTATESTLALPPNDLPDPDIMVATMSAARSYFRVEQVAIVIEVSDSTLRTDLGRKRAMYARHGIPEYWVVDVEGRKVHRFWSPSGGRFCDVDETPLAGELRSATIPDLAIDGTGIL